MTRMCLVDCRRFHPFWNTPTRVVRMSCRERQFFSKRFCGNTHCYVSCLVCLLRWGRCHEFESSGSARGSAGMVFCGVRSDSKTRERPVEQILIWASLLKETLPKHKPLFSYSEVKRLEWNRPDGRECVCIYIYKVDEVTLILYGYQFRVSVYCRNPAVGEGLL